MNHSICSQIVFLVSPSNIHYLIRLGAKNSVNHLKSQSIIAIKNSIVSSYLKKNVNDDESVGSFEVNNLLNVSWQTVRVVVIGHNVVTFRSVDFL